MQVPSQYIPVVHRFPHPPQCSGLLNVFTQAPAQHARPWDPQPASHPPPLEPAPLDEPPLEPLAPLLDVRPPPELPEPPPLDDEEEDEDEDEELASSDVPSVEASPLEPKVEPPHAAPTTAITQSTEDMGKIFCIDASSQQRPAALSP